MGDDGWEEVNDTMASLCVETPAVKQERTLVEPRSWDMWQAQFPKDIVHLFGSPTTHRVVFLTELTDIMKDAINKCIPIPRGPGVDMACNCCRSKVFRLIRYRDVNGNPCFLPSAKECYHSDFHPLWDAARTGEIIEACIATDDMFGLRTEGGFDHFSVNSEYVFRAYTPVEIDKYNRLLAKYDSMFHHTFTENGKSGLHDGLRLLPGCTTQDHLR